ncbi:MAG: hypothetical protein OEL83_03855 [Desulforhopalus sp.]|nr:hypothetical protein [Desulforhopalus sp.]
MSAKFDIRAFFMPRTGRTRKVVGKALFVKARKNLNPRDFLHNSQKIRWDSLSPAPSDDIAKETRPGNSGRRDPALA